MEKRKARKPAVKRKGSHAPKASGKTPRKTVAKAATKSVRKSGAIRPRKSAPAKLVRRKVRPIAAAKARVKPREKTALRKAAARKGWETRKRHEREHARGLRRKAESAKRKRELRKARIRKPKERETKLFRYRYRDYDFRTLVSRDKLRKLIRAETEGGKKRRLMLGTIRGKARKQKGEVHYSTPFMRATIENADEMYDAIEELEAEYGISQLLGVQISFTDMREGVV